MKYGKVIEKEKMILSMIILQIGLIVKALLAEATPISKQLEFKLDSISIK
jgi:hypothetical protein